MQNIINLVNKEKAPKITIPDGHFLIYIPAVTMEEIVESAGNKASDGKPLVYSDWMNAEKFYTEEKAREGWYLISTKAVKGSKDKTWSEQQILLKERGGEPITAAEALYCLYAYDKANNIKLTVGKDIVPYGWEYWRTSSLSSDGRIVSVGGFDDGGLCVAYGNPRWAGGGCGVCFACRILSNGPSESRLTTARTGTESKPRKETSRQALIRIADSLEVIASKLK